MWARVPGTNYITMLRASILMIGPKSYLVLILWTFTVNDLPKLGNNTKLSRTDALVEAAAYAVEGLFNLFVDESVENTKEMEQLGMDTKVYFLSSKIYIMIWA